MVDYGRKCFNDLHILKPEYSMIKKLQTITTKVLLFNEITLKTMKIDYKNKLIFG